MKYFSILIKILILLVNLSKLKCSKHIDNDSYESGDKKNNNESIYLVLNHKNIFTPNYSLEVSCIGSPIYFIDIINKKIMTLEVACKDTYLLINENGIITVILSDISFNVNKLKTKKKYYDEDLLSTFIIKKYDKVIELNNIPKGLLNFNFDLIPKDYDVILDSQYIKWIKRIQLIGIKTTSDPKLSMPNSRYRINMNDTSNSNNDIDINIPIKEPTYMIFLVNNDNFIAIPIFFTTNVIYKIKNHLLIFKEEKYNQNITESYNIKKGIYSKKGISIFINKIRNERIIINSSLYQLEELIQNKFNEIIYKLERYDNDNLSTHIQSSFDSNIRKYLRSSLINYSTQLDDNNNINTIIDNIIESTYSDNDINFTTPTKTITSNNSNTTTIITTTTTTIIPTTTTTIIPTTTTTIIPTTTTTIIPTTTTTIISTTTTSIIPTITTTIIPTITTIIPTTTTIIPTTITIIPTTTTIIPTTITIIPTTITTIIPTTTTITAIINNTDNILKNTAIKRNETLTLSNLSRMYNSIILLGD